eukprot:m.54677 g.54677  ORF g.54677 m.54677 type:complete len:273 (+) comp11438_c0_seq4:533-1351(+)
MAGFESNNELMKRRLASMLAAPVPVFPEVSSVDEGLRRALQLHMKTAIKHYGVNVVCFPASVYIFDRYAALTGEACEWSELHARKVGVLALQLATKQLHHECFPMEGLCELFQLDAFTEDDLQDLSTAVLSEFILKHPILPPCPYDICRLFVGRLNIPEGASWVENHAMVAVDRALSDYELMRRGPAILSAVAVRLAHDDLLGFIAEAKEQAEPAGNDGSWDPKFYKLEELFDMEVCACKESEPALRLGEQTSCASQTSKAAMMTQCTCIVC